MEKRTIRELLERRLSGEAEEHLLTFVAENAHDILLWRPEQICLKAQITERRLAAFFQTLGCQSLEDFRDVLRSVLYQTAEDSGIAQRSLASITDSVCQLRLNEHMNILTAHIYFKLSALNILKNTKQSVDYSLTVLDAYDALLCQHLRMSHRAQYILLVHLAVKADGRVKIVRQAICYTGISACPHFCHFLISLLQMPLFSRQLPIPKKYNMG